MLDSNDSPDIEDDAQGHLASDDANTDTPNTDTPDDDDDADDDVKGHVFVRREERDGEGRRG